MPKYEDYDDTMHPLSDSAEKALLIRRENINTNTTTVNNVSASIAATAQAASATATQGVGIEVANTNTDWINNKYRPMMGWTYMATCLFDFVVAPILWSIVQALGNGGVVSTQWQPLTLQGAGLYHVAMGAIIGISAFGRTQEKIAGKT